MRIFPTIASVFLTITTAANAQSSVINGAYAGCVTEDHLSEFIRAATNNDTRQMNALLGNVCINIDGLEYSLISRGLMRSQVRVYANGDSVVLWTVSEAVR